MVVAVSGSSGLIGSALIRSLAAAGHRAVRLVRGGVEAEDAIRWDPTQGIEDLSKLEGVDAVVHLAGETIGNRRWTAAQRAAIRRSRAEGTERLAESLAMIPKPPRVLVSASAVGFYGDRAGEILSEESAPGTDFFAQVCREWEAATGVAERAGIRVVHLRFGAVLSAGGGALRKMLLPFRLGLGGRVGSGRQFVSWIALDDAVGAIQHALLTESVRGPVNAVAPAPVTNAEFTRTLGRVLRRPTVMPLPRPAARFMFGEVADAVLLASQRVAPARLNASGYHFRYPELEGALRHLLGRERGSALAIVRGGSRVWR